MKQTITAATFALIALLSPGPAHAGTWTWPVSGEVITPYRNGDDPYAGGQHRGIDIAAPAGERIVAATAGTVTFAGVAGSSGLTVSVRTVDGGFDTSYLHLADTAVEEGDTVRAGDALGAVGTSGRRSAERPHLHLGVREAGERHAYRDPLDFLASPPPRGEPREPAPAPAPSEAPAEPRSAPVPAEPSGAPAPGPAPAGVRHGGPAPHAVHAPSAGRVPDPSSRPLPFPGADPFARRRSAPGAAARAAAARASARGDLPSRAHGRAIAGPDAAAGGDPAAAQSLPLGTAPVAVGRPAQDPARPAQDPASPASNTGATAPLGRRPEGRSGRGAVDAGWLAACIGLLFVATALGRSATAPRSRSGAPTAARRSVRAAGRLYARGARP